MQPDDKETNQSAIIADLASRMVKLGTGQLAQLRRMDVDGPGAGAFWHLQHEFQLGGDTLWMTQVKLMALLTPRGDPALPKRLHVDERGWGTALGETGYPERQVLRFLALPVAERPAMLERMARWLAAKNDGRGVNCIDLFWLLASSDARPARKLAERYYPAKYKHDKQSHPTKEEAR